MPASRASSASVGSLSQLISSLTSQIALVQSREAAVRADLARDRAQLAAVQSALTREQRLLALLRARLARARMLLARQLVTNYEQSKPNLVSVVLESNGFKDLLDQLTFLRDAQQQQQTIIALTRAAKARADAAAHRLAALRATDRQITIATAQRVRALAGMNLLLQSKQAAAGPCPRRSADRAGGQPLARGPPPVRDREARGGAGGGAGGGERAARRHRAGRPRRPHLDRAVGWVDPLRDRAVRVRRSEPDAE